LLGGNGGERVRNIALFCGGTVSPFRKLRTGRSCKFTWEVGRGTRKTAFHMRIRMGGQPRRLSKYTGGRVHLPEEEGGGKKDEKGGKKKNQFITDGERGYE